MCVCLCVCVCVCVCVVFVCLCACMCASLCLMHKSCCSAVKMQSHLFLSLGFLHPLLVQLTGIVLLIVQPQLAGEVGLYPPAVSVTRQSKVPPSLFPSIEHDRHSLPGKTDSTFITAVLGVGTSCVLAAWSMALYCHPTLLLIAPVAAPTTT